MEGFFAAPLPQLILPPGVIAFAGGFHGRGSAVPHIRTGEADVRGSLSREVIRRVIRRHINEVRFCYEQELAQRPDLAGRVTVSFIISATGSVPATSRRNSLDMMNGIFFPVRIARAMA